MRRTTAPSPAPAPEPIGRAFSGAGEKSGGKGRKRTHRGDPGRSPQLDAENRLVRKCLALLRMPERLTLLPPASEGAVEFDIRKDLLQAKLRQCEVALEEVALGVERYPMWTSAPPIPAAARPSRFLCTNWSTTTRSSPRLPVVPTRAIWSACYTAACPLSAAAEKSPRKRSPQHGA